MQTTATSYLAMPDSSSTKASHAMWTVPEVSTQSISFVGRSCRTSLTCAGTGGVASIVTGTDADADNPAPFLATTERK
eukprot:256032-Rhodomonas_salina.1